MDETLRDTLVLPPFTVTPRAIAAIDHLGGAVRLDLEPGGCCGTFYAFTLLAGDTQPQGDDMRFGCDGAWLHVSAAARAVLDGAVLDHAPTLRPPRFRVLRNPNVADSCPCRRSFGRPWPGPGSAECRSYLPMPWDTTYEPPSAWQRRTGWRRPGDD